MSNKNSPLSNSFLQWPFAGQIFSIVLMAVLMPGAWGVWALIHGKLIFGVLTILVWSYPYFLLVKYLNSKELVRFIISIPCTILILIAVLFI
jgi:hypothetical protein